MDAVLEPFPADRLFPGSSFLDLGDLNESDFLNSAFSAGSPGATCAWSSEIWRGEGAIKASAAVALELDLRWGAHRGAFRVPETRRPWG
ncbi:hypothetical protein P7K49_021867 [Saguinus oedipus]|uniref:Uncharacterized protein n=1 Tax=Saguinus oedipus TaxID=9490 RepID=A0ABQ9UTU9_SAGOE|nr:hypothetical protein P7K49_021867 [Saguinus oedipus]